MKRAGNKVQRAKGPRKNWYVKDSSEKSIMLPEEYQKNQYKTKEMCQLAMCLQRALNAGRAISSHVSPKAQVDPADLVAS